MQILTPATLLALATLCSEDYAPIPDDQIIDAGDDIRAVITLMGEYVVPSIRGTVITDPENWLTDLDFVPAYHPATGWVPRGFLCAALRLLPLVKARVAGLRVILCGHSLGGAVAALLAALLIHEGVAVVAYALAEPARSGGHELAAALAGVEGWACRFGNDPVPMLPPLYQHPCSLVAIGEDRPDGFECHSILGVVAALGAMVVPAGGSP